MNFNKFYIILYRTKHAFITASMLIVKLEILCVKCMSWEGPFWHSHNTNYHQNTINT